MESGGGSSSSSSKGDTWFDLIPRENIQRIVKHTVITDDGWTCNYSRVVDDNDKKPDVRNANKETERSSTTILALKFERDILSMSDGRRTSDYLDSIVTGNAQKIFIIGNKFLATISGETYYSLRLIDIMERGARNNFSFFGLCQLAKDEIKEWTKNNGVARYPATVSLIGFAYEKSRSRALFMGKNAQEDKRTLEIYSAGSGAKVAENKLKNLIKDKKVNLHDISSAQHGMRISILQSGIEDRWTGGRINEGTVSRDQIPGLRAVRPHQLELVHLNYFYNYIDWPAEALILISRGSTMPEAVHTFKGYLENISKARRVRLLGRSRDLIFWMMSSFDGFSPRSIESLRNANLQITPLELLKLDQKVLDRISVNFRTINEEDQW